VSEVPAAGRRTTGVKNGNEEGSNEIAEIAKRRTKRRPPGETNIECTNGIE